MNALLRAAARAAVAVLPALALAVVVPDTAHAAGTYRNDDGTMEASIRMDATDGTDDFGGYVYLPGGSVYGATSARVWVYGQATDCDVEGPGHRLSTSWFYSVDFDPCDVFPQGSYAWHAFTVPRTGFLDTANNSVYIEDLDDYDFVSGYHPAVGLRHGHKARYGIDTDATTNRYAYEDDYTRDWPLFVYGEPMIYVEMVGSVPYLSTHPWFLDFGTRDTGTTSAPQTESVWNLGLAATSVAVTFTGQAAGDYAVSSSTCGSLPARTQCSISFRFTPQAPGTRFATAVLTATGAEPETIELRGEGRTGPPTSTIATPDGSVVLATDTVTGTVTGLSYPTYEHVVFTPSVPAQPTVQLTAALDCDGGSCTWSTDALRQPGVYTVRAYGIDRQGNVESPGPSVTVTVI